MDKIIECVPNFSEGRNLNIINSIRQSIESVSEINVLDVFIGKDTNRTVMTFAGSPEKVCEAAFRGIKTASELIDMQKQKGKHPRIGATDVCPLIPVSGISMYETAKLAQKLGQRVGEECGIPVYCYEYAALTPEREKLEICRSGEYEGLKNKLSQKFWKPDFGPDKWSENIAKTGATIIGARNFLIAWNINLDTNSLQKAKEIAREIRESGYLKEGRRVPGKLKFVKAIGWYIKEYGFTQISMNLTNIDQMPLHTVYETAIQLAMKKGIRVTGSELIGLIPLKALVDSGRYYFHKEALLSGKNEKQIINKAIQILGLEQLHPFDPREKILEYTITQ